MTKRLRVVGMATAVLTIFMGTVSAYSAEIKSIHYNEYKISEDYTSQADTLGEFFDETDIELLSGDKILVNEEEVEDIGSAIYSGDHVTVKRAYYVDVVIDGVTYSTKVTDGIVEDALEQYTSILGETYTVDNYDISAVLRRNMVIEVTTTQETTEVATAAIPYETVYVENPEMPVGETRVVQKGTEGVNMITYYKTYVGGETVGSNETHEVVSETVDEIIEIGSKAENMIDGHRYKDAIVMNASAYTAYCSGVKSLTATGTEAVRGVVAVDTRVIPFGTKVYIPGYGVARAEDTGSAIKGNKIDLCMDSYDEAIQWGRQDVTVYILE